VTAPITFSRLVEARANSNPASVAMDSAESGSHSWRDLHDRGHAFARVLAALGAARAEPIVTMTHADFDGVALWAGCARLGALEVPVNHAYRGQWLRETVSRVGARLAIVDAEFLPHWRAVLSGTGLETVVVVASHAGESVDGVTIVGVAELLAGSTTSRDVQDVSEAEDLAVLIHTSGTTGVSKGVMLPWTALAFRCNQRYTPAMRLGSGVVCYAPFAPFHWSGRGKWFDMALHETRLVTAHRFKTDKWLPHIRRFGCTTTSLVGAMAPFVMQSPARPDDSDNPLELVQIAPLPPNVDEFKERFGVPEVISAYQMTETPLIFVTPDSDFVTSSTSRSCGVAAGDVPIRLVDQEGHDVQTGEVGELLVGGGPTVVNLGYYKMPDASAKAWEGGWFHTGDLFRYDEDGRYYFVDRAKDALRRRGENISSVEIEAILNQHPAVAESAVIGVPSEFGEDEVMAIVVPLPGCRVTPEELVDFVQPQIAQFAVPRYVEFVESLPRTVTHKIRKGPLREAGITAATWDRLKNRGRRDPAPTAENK